jgi:hypothetical protein
MDSIMGSQNIMGSDYGSNISEVMPLNTSAAPPFTEESSGGAIPGLRYNFLKYPIDLRSIACFSPLCSQSTMRFAT